MRQPANKVQAALACDKVPLTRCGARLLLVCSCCSHGAHGIQCRQQMLHNRWHWIVACSAHFRLQHQIVLHKVLCQLAGSAEGAGRCSSRSWQVQWRRTLFDLTTVSSRSSTEHVRSCKPLPGVNFSSGLALGVLRTHCCGELRALPGGTAPLDCTASQADSCTHTSPYHIEEVLTQEIC